MSTNNPQHPVITTTAGKYTLEWFPPELIALREEIQHHPDLLVILHAQADKDVYIHICEIAAYCRILLNGEYTRDDIINLCDKLVMELKKLRVAVIS
jgi:hypothetical protein